MVRQAEIVVGAKVDDIAAADLDGRALRALQLAFTLVEPLGLELVELGAQMIAQALLTHGGWPSCEYGSIARCRFCP
jgi:hypothetical protein